MATVRAGLRRLLWGPAAGHGRLPRWLCREAFAVALLSTAAVLGAGAAAPLTGLTALHSGAVGTVCVAATVLYLLVVRARWASVAIVATFGLALAPFAPNTAVDLALAGQGEQRSALVTSVTPGLGTPRRYCTVSGPDGIPLARPIWRGCTAQVGPGDRITVLHDPEGRLPPRGLDLVTSLTETTGRAAGFAVVTFLSVIRSYSGTARVALRSYDRPTTGACPPRAEPP
ncbi:hypothetical protein ACQPZG_02365 (plasmid) [Streptomyces sp. CA-294286]|uniref:hypothetical protein n=1 Tax=Streptomyces sp. CA-294286 TaxID=3240070 RepID=UPI003D89DD9C